MPTPDYAISNAPSATTTPQSQTATACPIPLTPPLEEAISREAETLSDNALRTNVQEYRSEYGNDSTSNNTATGMATNQEESLYLGMHGTQHERVTDDHQRRECNTSGTDSGENGHPKLPVTLGTADSTQPEITPAPLSPQSMLSYSPRPNESGSPTHDVAHATNQPPTDRSECRKATDSEKAGAQPSRTIRKSPPRSISKVDGELDWRSVTNSSDFTHKRLEPRYPSALFQCDSRYEGTQQSDRQTYNVHVRILTVDMDQCSCTGYLTIKGLTPEHETLQTYFTGEIIGGPDQRYSFRTKTPEWGAGDKTDLGHWARFQAWRSYAAVAKKNLEFAYPPNGQNWWQQDHVFMRWKEHFLVPDHKTDRIAGASFDGFYYICLNQIEGRISGIYFHSKSEKYQQLELKHEGGSGTWHRGVTPCVEFR